MNPSTLEKPGFDEPPAGNVNTIAKKMAEAIGVTTEQLLGACDPQENSPYLHLNAKCWEAFKKHTPPRGRGAVSPIALSGTLSALWAKFAGQASQSQQMAQDVLETINQRDNNPPRSLQNTSWLLNRAGKIALNPAEISKAEAVARGFCLKQPINWEGE